MALKTKYEFQNIIYDEAYLRIQKISIGHSEREEIVDDPQIGGERVIFKTFTEPIAFCMVYADKDARDRVVRPLTQFAFQFKYDINSTDNPFQIAYQALKKQLSLTDEVEDI